MRKVLVLMFFILAFLSCKSKNTLQDYINKGFYKPSINNSINLIPQSIGDGGNIYVPSGREINFSLKLDNKYDVPLKVNVIVPDEKKHLFEKLPEVKNIETKIIELSFEFKAEAEPSGSNNFLGESVPIEIIIHNRENEREFHRLSVDLNCNTSPLSILDSAITYNEENDEFVIHTPKNTGIHNDLKELIIELSTEKDSQKYKQNFSIANVAEQDQDIVLQVKDLLSKPSSKRKIKVIVKDKAGLLSEQIVKDSGAKKFTSITLVPPTFNVTKKLSIEDGFAPPKIKELHNFFQKKEDWESSGYKVEYDVTGTPFEYNKTKDLFFNKQAGLGSFLITIILKQPLHPDVNSTWSVTITAKNDANLATEGILIEDKTNYSMFSNIKELKPLSSIKNLLFTTDSSGVKIAICDIDYTDFDTNLKVSLKTNDDQAKIGKEGGVDLTNSYEESIELEKHAGSLKDITFIITAEDDSIQKYKIVFKRKPSVQVSIKIEFDHGTLTTEKAKLEAEWDYGKTSTKKDIVSFFIAQGKDVDFNINLPNDWKIEKVFSSFIPHGLSDGKANRYTLTASADFILTLKIKPQVVVSWEVVAGDSNGIFSSANIDGKELNSQPNKITATRDGSSAIFVVQPNAGYRVKEWLINGNKVISNTQNIRLEDDNKTLKLYDMQTNVVVSVSFREDTYEVKWEIPNNSIASIQVLINGESKTSGLEHVLRGTEVHFAVSTNEGYKFKEWVGDVEAGNETNNSFNIVVKKDIEIKAIFLCKISVELDASAHENAEIHLKIKAPDGGSVSEEYVAKKGSPIDGIEFEVGSTIILKSNEGYEVTEWFNNGVMLLSPPFKSGSLVSSDVSVENARRNYKLKAKMGRRS